MNTVNAGAGVPVVFKLPGNQGLNIFENGSPQSQTVNCQDWASAPTDPIESTVSTPGGLTYDATSDTYTYVWKTTKSWAGTCRRLILKFAPARGARPRQLARSRHHRLVITRRKVAIAVRSLTSELVRYRLRDTSSYMRMSFSSCAMSVCVAARRTSATRV